LTLEPPSTIRIGEDGKRRRCRKKIRTGTHTELQNIYQDHLAENKLYAPQFGSGRDGTKTLQMNQFATIGQAHVEVEQNKVPTYAPLPEKPLKSTIRASINESKTNTFEMEENKITFLHKPQKLDYSSDVEHTEQMEVLFDQQRGWKQPVNIGETVHDFKKNPKVPKEEIKPASPVGSYTATSTSSINLKPDEQKKMPRQRLTWLLDPQPPKNESQESVYYADESSDEIRIKNVAKNDEYREQQELGSELGQPTDEPKQDENGIVEYFHAIDLNESDSSEDSCSTIDDYGSDADIRRKFGDRPYLRDFVKVNALQVIRRPARKVLPFVIDDKCGTRKPYMISPMVAALFGNSDFGRVPGYLQDRNLELGRPAVADTDKFYQSYDCKYRHGHVHCKDCKKPRPLNKKAMGMSKLVVENGGDGNCYKVCCRMAKSRSELEELLRQTEDEFDGRKAVVNVNANYMGQLCDIAQGLRSGGDMGDGNFRRK